MRSLYITYLWGSYVQVRSKHEVTTWPTYVQVAVNMQSLHNIPMSSLSANMKSLHNIPMPRLAANMRSLHNVPMSRLVANTWSLHNIPMSKLAANMRSLQEKSRGLPGAHSLARPAASPTYTHSLFVTWCQNRVCNNDAGLWIHWWLIDWGEATLLWETVLLMIYCGEGRLVCVWVDIGVDMWGWEAFI